MEISVTPAEQKAERLIDTHLAQALRAVRQDGYVILANVIDPAHLDIIHERMEADSQILINARRWGGAGRAEGHLKQGPPPCAPYVFRDVVANPFAVQVAHTLLGDGMYNRYYNGNCNCPGSGLQPLHMDGPHLFAGMKEPHPVVSVVINVCLVDVSAENGAMELWPGTHLLVSGQRRIDPATEARRQQIVPPRRANTPKGSLLIRDMRLWHRGMPNHSDHVRHMIAMIYQKAWLKSPGPLLYSADCQNEFPAHSPLDHNAIFTDQPLSYLFERYARVQIEA